MILICLRPAMTRVNRFEKQKKEIEKILSWLDVDKLTLNVKKTHFMVFRNCRRKLTIHDTLMIRGHEIEIVESTKFLVVYLDSGLTWRNHIDYIKGKIARGIGILCKARKYLKENTLITSYYSFIYPYLCYCIEVWENTYKSYIEPLLRLQKKVLRIITGSKKLSHTAPLFNELNNCTMSPYKCLCINFIIRHYLISSQIFIYAIQISIHIIPDSICVNMCLCHD